MRIQRSIFLVFVAVVFLHGCTSVSDSAILKNDEGVIATTLKCQGPMSGLDIFRSGVSSKQKLISNDRSSYLICIDGVQSINLKEGKYYVGGIIGAGFAYASIDENDALKFEVFSNKVNYIGALSIKAIPIKKLSNITFLSFSPLEVRDLSNKTFAEFSLSHKNLLSRYQWVKDIAAK